MDLSRLCGWKWSTRLGVRPRSIGLGDWVRRPDQDVGVPDRRHPEFRRWRRLPPRRRRHVYSMGVEAWLLGQAEERPLHRVARVAQREIGNIGDEQVELRPGPVPGGHGRFPAPPYPCLAAIRRSSAAGARGITSHDFARQSAVQERRGRVRTFRQSSSLGLRRGHRSGVECSGVVLRVSVAVRPVRCCPRRSKGTGAAQVPCPSLLTNFVRSAMPRSSCGPGRSVAPAGLGWKRSRLRGSSPAKMSPVFPSH